MLKNYKLVKTYDLESMQQQIKDLNYALTEATDLLDRAGKIIDEQRELIDRQRKFINKQQKQIRKMIGIDMDLDFPNSRKGGYQDQ